MRNEPFPQTRVVDDDRLQEILASHATPARDQFARVAVAPLISKRVLTSLVRLGDSLVATLIGAAIWFVYLHPESYAESASYVTFLLGVGLVVPVLFAGAGLYSIHAFMRPVEQLARLTASWFAIFAGLFAILFFAQAGDSYSRVWAATWFLSGLGGLIAFRGIVALCVKRWNSDGRLDRRAVLFGGGKPAEDLI